MNFISKRVVALASAATIAASTFGAVAAGAYAQDRAEAVTLETVNESKSAEQSASEPEVRFVANEVVQPVPVVEPIAVEAVAEPVTAGSLRELITTIDTGDSLSRDMRCLAQAVYFEARGEPIAGQLAVAQVVINRSANGQFPDDYCSVVTQRAQFSFVRSGQIPEPNRVSQAWHRAKAIAKIAHRGLWESAADDALYFHATHVRPRWARSKQARTTIDRHVFYR